MQHRTSSLTASEPSSHLLLFLAWNLWPLGILKDQPRERNVLLFGCLFWLVVWLFVCLFVCFSFSSSSSLSLSLLFLSSPLQPSFPSSSFLADNYSPWQHPSNTLLLNPSISLIFIFLSSYCTTFFFAKNVTLPLTSPSSFFFLSFFFI